MTSGAGAMTVTTRVQDISSTVALIAACLAFGGAIGWMTVYLFSVEPVQGWSSVQRAAGALVVGSVSGALTGVYLARDLSARARWWSTGFAVLLAAGTLWSLALTDG
jgi:hypothetical protein